MKTISDWISTEDRLPVPGQRCLVWSERYKSALFAYFTADNTFEEYFYGKRSMVKTGSVTHWMPEPERPR